MTDGEMMQQALRALEWHLEKGAWGANIEGVTAALRQRLAQKERQWQGLTDVEVGRLTVFDGLHHVEVPVLADFIRAIEAKIKEKNT